MKSYIKDYPRPQLVRDAKSFEILNGEWKFAFDDLKEGLDEKFYNGFKSNLKINVPFVYESKASGINDQSLHEQVWYSLEKEITKEKLENSKIMIHFEGSDYITKVWVNGNYIGEHTGGYARFSFDITNWVVEGKNLICVMVQDSFDEHQPRGKQRYKEYNYGCRYIQNTGIWKTVWLEYLPKSYISNLKITPLMKEESVKVECDLNKNSNERFFLETVISFKNDFVSSSKVAITSKHTANTINVYNIDNYEYAIFPWSPQNPNLYDIEINLIDSNNNVIDKVYSYFGMREITIRNGNVLLNEVPIYQRLVLDQGYWKDTLMTPPSEEAIIEDIDKTKALGYNGVRKHQKVEDERYLYWCDVKGMLVWSEMAAAFHFNDYAVDKFMKEWTEVVLQNYSHPSIITWTPINESWGIPQVKTNYAQQSFTQAVYYLTKAIDPYRPVIVNDGWENTISDIITLHDYTPEGDIVLDRYKDNMDDILSDKIYYNLTRATFAVGFSYKGQPIIMSEYGGIAYNNDDNGWGYGKKVETKEEFIERFDSITTAIKKLPAFCGYCYTQLTDIQQEINGLMDIDRNFKVDCEKIAEINKRKVSPFHN